MPFISVIIPLYNKENYIQNTLKSVLEQDFFDFEIIIIDDCSTDKSLSIVQNMASEKTRILTHSHNKGLSATRNTGIKNAKANYITFIDADDLWEPFFLSEIYLLITKYPTATIFGTNYQEIIFTKKIEPKQKPIFKKNETGLINNYFSTDIRQPLYCYSSVAFSKKVFDKIGYFDEDINFSEDIDFNIRANLNHTLAYSNKISASYVTQTENQITTSGIDQKTIPNFDRYECFCTKENQLKIYLDFYRYTFAMRYKIAKDQLKFSHLKSNIDYHNLTWKQKLLLELPLFMTLFLKKIKQLLLRLKIRVTSY